MINTDKLLQQFAGYGIGTLLITDTEWNILYQTGKPAIDSERWGKWSIGVRGEVAGEQVVEWEIAEKDAGVYYRVHTAELTDEGRRLLVHHVYDISDFAALFHDLSMYSRDWHTLSTCQQEMIGAMSDDCRAILPIVIKYFNASRAVLLIKRRNETECHELEKNTGKICAMKLPPESTDMQYTAGEKYGLPGAEGEYLCCAGGDTVSGEKYALFVKTDESSPDDLLFPLYFNVFKLFIENSLLREKIVFESEHDHLTKLYNKGKYNELIRQEFPFYNSIAVFFMDVNYLKRTNDTLGHEAGNRLLEKAGESIKAIVGEGVYAFRLGGDEFVIVVAEADEEKAAAIKAEWQKKLDELNEAEPVPECVIACGVNVAKQPYDVSDVFGEADRLMYLDKRAIKIARGDDPNSR